MKKKKRSIFKRILFFVLLIFFIGLLIPHPKHMPVKGATAADYHPDSFWFYPWGRSVTHKGVDVFAREGTEVQSAASGIVVYKGNIAMGGNVVLILGPKWRLHYYAHLQSSSVGRFSFVGTGSPIGKVGSTGNAAGKPPHLHYSIMSMVALPWRIDSAPQGWRKMFYLNPINYFGN